MTFQIIQSISKKFSLVNESVTAIREKVKNLLEDGRTFIPGDAGAKPYQKCCEATDLGEDSRFPNVST